MLGHMIYIIILERVHYVIDALQVSESIIQANGIKRGGLVAAVVLRLWCCT
jgi:hypothetical protein